jgi:hypothetical protein
LNQTTVAFNNGGAAFTGAAISEWRGVNFLEQFALQAIASSQFAPSPSITTTHAGDH